MSNLKQFVADNETIEILKCGFIKGKVYFLPDITLDRIQYNAVNKILIALGAKWDRKIKGHVFDYDISNELKKVIETGNVTDWKKTTDFFYTPKAVVNEMIGLVQKPRADLFTMLEPEAGQGHILDNFREIFYKAKIFCIENNPLHCERLREKSYNPICEDFLSVIPFGVDVVLMNPPFKDEIEHIKHAYEFLNSDGRLITICTGNIFTKSFKRNKEFKQWFDDKYGYSFLLPPNSFNEAGTNVSTQILILDK